MFVLVDGITRWQNFLILNCMLAVFKLDNSYTPPPPPSPPAAMPNITDRIITLKYRSKRMLLHIKAQFICKVLFRSSLASLSKDVFERRTSTGSEAFYLSICLDANKFVLLTFFSLLKTIYPRVLTKPLANDTKSPLPVDVHVQKLVT